MSLSIRCENCVDANSGIGSENYVAVDSGISSDSGVDFWHSFLFGVCILPPLT